MAFPCEPTRHFLSITLPVLSGAVIVMIAPPLVRMLSFSAPTQLIGPPPSSVLLLVPRLKLSIVLSLRALYSHGTWCLSFLHTNPFFHSHMKHTLFVWSSHPFSESLMSPRWINLPMLLPSLYLVVVYNYLWTILASPPVLHLEGAY